MDEAGRKSDDRLSFYTPRFISRSTLSLLSLSWRTTTGAGWGESFGEALGRVGVCSRTDVGAVFTTATSA